MTPRGLVRSATRLATARRARQLLRMRTRLALFDFDGTLADSLPWFMAVTNALAETHGFRRVQREELEVLRGKPAREVTAHLGVRWWQLPAIGRDYRRRMAAADATIALFPGVDALLRRVHAAGIAIGIVTSNSEANARRVLGTELSTLVDHWECDAGIFGKAPRLRRAVKRAGVAPGEALAIGDELRDLEAARAAGIPFAAVAWGFTLPDALRAAGPDAMYATVEELAEALAPA